MWPIASWKAISNTLDAFSLRSDSCFEVVISGGKKQLCSWAFIIEVCFPIKNAAAQSGCGHGGPH